MFSFVNLWELSNHTLFDDIVLPTGTYYHTNSDGTQELRTISPNKDILINSIFDEVAEYEPLTIDVDVMKMKINNFFLKYEKSFERLIAINLVTYSPIENTDKYESRINEVNRISAGSDDLIHKVSAFNSNQLEVANQDNATSKQTSNDNATDTIHAHGNIGVTTNQQMLTAEIEFWNKFSFYKIVADKFLFELCIPVSEVDF